LKNSKNKYGGKNNLNFSGPDPGYLTNSRKWRNTTVASFKSPFSVQSDVGKKKIKYTKTKNQLTIFYVTGFFALENKRYGQFLVGVQTFSRRIFVTPLPNLTLSSFLKAFQLMLKVIFLAIVF
jgi:hypothetical protein